MAFVINKICTNHSIFEGIIVGDELGEEGTLRYFVDIGIIVSTFEFMNGDGVEPLLSLKLNLRKNPAGCICGGRNVIGLNVLVFAFEELESLFILFLMFWVKGFVTESLASLEHSILLDSPSGVFVVFFFICVYLRLNVDGKLSLVLVLSLKMK